MKKNNLLNYLLKLGIILVFIMVITLGYLTHKNYKEKEQLIYNENILSKTLEQQVSYLEKNKDCNQDVLKTSDSILKHLKITQTKLKNKIGIKKDESLLEKKFQLIREKCLNKN